MKKTLTLLAILVAALSALAGENANTVKIGVILPLTGDSDSLGLPLLRAVKLFESECSKGNYKHQYKVIVEDDQLLARESAVIAQKFINIDHVDAIITFSSTAGNVITPQARNKNIPHLCISSDLKVADDKFSFLHWPNPEVEAAAGAHLVENLGGHRVAIMTVRHAGAMAVQKYFEAELKKRGIEIVGSELFNPGERDFRFQLAKMRELKPDVFVPIAFSPELEILLRQRKQTGITVKTTTMECFDFLADTSDVEGCFYVSAGLGTNDFQKRIMEATGKPTAYAVAYEYDMLNIIRSAYETMDRPDHAMAARYIRQLKDFPSALGTTSMGPNGRIDSPVSIFRIIHGKQTPTSWEDVK
jgi:branched-chain amino acid transport system substrate-binding protein